MMRRWLAFGLLLIAGGNDLHATQVFSGQAPSGAWYRIEAPDDWRPGDALVLYQHGLDFGTADGPPSLGPLKSVMLAEGFAVAASAFNQRGWAMFTAVADNRELLGLFEQKLGAPGEIVPFGGSLGGLIALKLAEAPGFPPVHGAYSLCPAAAGSRIWDTAIDARLAYDVICRDAGSLPTGAQPLPWALDADDIPDDLGDLLDQALVLESLVPLNRCTGINLPSYLRNDAMKRRLAELMAFTRIDSEKFLVTNLGYSIYVMSDLVRAPDKLGGRNPFTTAGVDYGSNVEVQAEIARVRADPRAAARLQQVSDFRGRVGDAKILSIHTSRDELVIPSNQEFVRKALPPDQLTSAIVDEDEPTHCGFSDAEGLAGWEALRAWKDGAAQPDVAALQQLCDSLVDEGHTEGPCRFDAQAQIVPFDDVVRPRQQPPLQPPAHSRRPLPPAPHGDRQRGVSLRP